MLGRTVLSCSIALNVALGALLCGVFLAEKESPSGLSLKNVVSSLSPKRDSDVAKEIIGGDVGINSSNPRIVASDPGSQRARPVYPANAGLTNSMTTLAAPVTSGSSRGSSVSSRGVSYVSQQTGSSSVMENVSSAPALPGTFVASAGAALVAPAGGSGASRSAISPVSSGGGASSSSSSSETPETVPSNSSPSTSGDSTAMTEEDAQNLRDKQYIDSETYRAFYGQDALIKAMAAAAATPADANQN